MKKKRHCQPVSVLDVAAYILANHTKNNPISAWKMHKLVFYCQVWSLVHEKEPFFHEKVLATRQGIVFNELRPQHRGQLYVGNDSKGNLNHLSLKQVDIIDEVMKTYGHKSLEELDASILHETRWKEMRQSMRVKEDESIEIPLTMIATPNLT